MSILLLAMALVPALPHCSGPTRPEPTVDLVALARDELPLGPAHDPYARIPLPHWQALLAEWALQVGADRPISPISQRLPHGLTMTSPFDMVAQHRAPLEFCPGYWPEHQPGKTLEDFCHDDYLYRPWLYDGQDRNPFAIAQQGVRLLNRDRSLARPGSCAWHRGGGRR